MSPWQLAMLGVGQLRGMNAAAKNWNNMSNNHQPLALPAVVISLVVVAGVIIPALAVVAPLAIVIGWAVASALVITVAVAVVVHLCEGGSRQPAPPNQHVRERAAFDASAHEAPPICTRRDAEMQRYCAG